MNIVLRFPACRGRLSVLWIGLLFFRLVPCQAQSQSAQEPWGLLEYAESESVKGLNPYRLETARGATDRLFALIYEGLLRYDYDEERYVPMLAESYTIESDTLITFTLRPTVRWHDGEPFSAEDVTFTYAFIKRLAPEQLRKQYASLTLDIIDPLTVRATFSEPVVDLLQYFDTWIIPAHHFRNFAPAPRTTPLEEFPVGTGPFKFRRQSIEGHISIDVNDAYWSDQGRIKSVKMNKVTDPSQMVLSAMYGNHRLMIQVPPGQINTLEALKTFNIEQYPSFAIYAFAYHCTHPALRDPRVRQALTYATNRQKMLDQWFNGKGHLISSPFNNSSPYYDHTIKPFPHDPDKARALLQEAGYLDRNGDGVLEYRSGRKLSLELVNFVEKAAGTTTNQNLAASYKSDLAAVGVEVNLIDLPLETYRKRLFLDHDFDIALVEWTFDPIYDVTDLFDSESFGGNNIVRYSDTRVDEIIRQFHQARDPEARIDLMHELQKILAEANPYTFVLSVDKNAALHRSLAGYRIDPYYFFSYFAQWYFAQDFRD
ncbi:MAG: ABC transporter substrate-binding protein [Rhodothermales bacterium]